jgi:hypothetical protein
MKCELLKSFSVHFKFVAIFFRDSNRKREKYFNDLKWSKWFLKGFLNWNIRKICGEKSPYLCSVTLDKSDSVNTALWFWKSNCFKTPVCKRLWSFMNLVFEDRNYLFLCLFVCNRDDSMLCSQPAAEKKEVWSISRSKLKPS